MWYDFRHHWSRSTYYANHEADLLRLLMLRRRGGVYVDTDFILLRPLLSSPTRNRRIIVLARRPDPCAAAS